MEFERTRGISGVDLEKKGQSLVFLSHSQEQDPYLLASAQPFQLRAMTKLAPKLLFRSVVTKQPNIVLSPDSRGSLAASLVNSSSWRTLSRESRPFNIRRAKRARARAAKRAKNFEKGNALERNPLFSPCFRRFLFRDVPR